MKVVHIETRATGSRVYLRTSNRDYMAAVMPNGEIIAVDIASKLSEGFWRCNRFNRDRYPRRITDAVRQALAH
ncbi:MAG: hypothetical protein KF748_01260 [Xanthobacteraceae bacterium]|nr:hypothetical protein [Xanthobacteraceae bacterium]MBX3547761.1 hypothetical protein [Xanthobacteraceae bacterium]